MTHSAPTDFYDDGLVHSHDWSRSTPPGGQHTERHQSNDRDRHMGEHKPSHN